MRLIGLSENNGEVKLEFTVIILSVLIAFILPSSSRNVALRKLWILLQKLCKYIFLGVRTRHIGGTYPLIERLSEL